MKHSSGQAEMNKQVILDSLRGFVRRYQREQGVRTRWRQPLLGLAAAADPLFPELRRVVSPGHALPGDLLPGARTVMACFLPLGEEVAASNIPGQAASREWVLAYLETNALIRAVCLHLKEMLEAGGHAVVVTPPTHNFDPGRLVSDWSHRHVVFVAGLGQFGLNKMLITESGCCGRLGTLVTSLELAADPRPAGEFCLYRHDGSCARCTQRCVGKALLPDRFDRRCCYQVCLVNEERHRALGRADVCGKCLVDVPCSFVNPVKVSGRSSQPLAQML